MGTVIEIFAEVSILLLVGYFLMYKKFAEELGKQSAEILLIKEKIYDVESVKKIFNEELEAFKKQMQLDIAKEVEPLRSTLSRENIGYQIINTEFIKLRFQRLDDLYGKIYELKKYCHRSFFLYADEQDYKNKIIKYNELYKNVEDAMYRAAIYIDETVTVSVIDLLNKTNDAIKEFNTYYITDLKRYKSIFNSNRQDLIQSLVDRNNNSLERLVSNLDELPTLLRNIKVEFKKHLTK
jgi:hypothetical protein